MEPPNLAVLTQKYKPRNFSELHLFITILVATFRSFIPDFYKKIDPFYDIHLSPEFYWDNPQETALLELLKEVLRLKPHFEFRPPLYRRPIPLIFKIL